MTFDEEQLKKRGFASEKEFLAIVATVPLPNREAMERFKEWRDRKGTKAELESIAKGEQE